MRRRLESAVIRGSATTIPKFAILYFPERNADSFRLGVVFAEADPVAVA